MLARMALIHTLSGDMEAFAPFAPGIFSKGLLGNTIEEYKRAIEYHSGEGSSHLRLGGFYEAMGFDGGHRTSIRKLLATAPMGARRIS